MDIRNIKEEPKVVEEGKYLEEMFNIADVQLSSYINYGPEEELPQEWPISVNPPSNQVVLKDFIDRVTEELMEGYESTQKAYEICLSKGWNFELLSEKEIENINNHLQNACEEQADAIGFFMTLFLYANIDAQDIYDFALSTSKVDISDLDAVMILGSSYQDVEDGVKNHYSLPILDKNKDYIPGFNSMSVYSHLFTEKECIFNVSYYLNMARNALKCRPWKRTQVMTKEVTFQKYLVSAFYMYMGFLKISGFTPEKIYREYFKKFKLNMWRIKTAY